MSETKSLIQTHSQRRARFADRGFLLVDIGCDDTPLTRAAKTTATAAPTRTVAQSLVVFPKRIRASYSSPTLSTETLSGSTNGDEAGGWRRASSVAKAESGTLQTAKGEEEDKQSKGERPSYSERIKNLFNSAQILQEDYWNKLLKRPRGGDGDYKHCFSNNNNNDNSNDCWCYSNNHHHLKQYLLFAIGIIIGITVAYAPLRVIITYSSRIFFSAPNQQIELQQRSAVASESIASKASPLAVTQPTTIVNIPDNFELYLQDVFTGTPIGNIDILPHRLHSRPQEAEGVPFYWHIPMSGGAVLHQLFGTCLRFVQASSIAGGGGAGHGGNGEEKILRIITSPQGDHYLNVNLSSEAGIQRAKDMGVAANIATDVVTSEMLYQATTLFSTKKPGRMFTILRHPIQRAVHAYLNFQQKTLLSGGSNVNKNNMFQNLTLEEFASSGNSYSGDWMVRFLTGRRNKEEILTDNDLLLAKEILRRKCLVGIHSHFAESFTMFMKYFNWSALVAGASNTLQQRCVDRILDHTANEDQTVFGLDQDSPASNVFMDNNSWDIKLYEYAVALSNQQYRAIFELDDPVQ